MFFDFLIVLLNIFGSHTEKEKKEDLICQSLAFLFLGTSFVLLLQFPEFLQTENISTQLFLGGIFCFLMVLGIIFLLNLMNWMQPLKFKNFISLAFSSSILLTIIGLQINHQI
jgi:hypothetical protein